MVVVTFLEYCEFTGKRFIPFCTNEGSGIGRSVKDIMNICTSAIVDEGISILGSQAIYSDAMISEWVQE